MAFWHYVFRFCSVLKKKEENLIAFRMFRVCSVFLNWNHTKVFIYFKKMSHNDAMNWLTKLSHPIGSGKLLKFSMNCRIHYAKWPIWRNLFGLRIPHQNLALLPKKHVSIFAKWLKGTIVDDLISLAKIFLKTFLHNAWYARMQLFFMNEIVLHDCEMCFVNI